MGLRLREAGDDPLGQIEIDKAKAARAAEQPAAILIDEVQYLNDEDLRALIVALHRISQKALPLLMFGAGLLVGVIYAAWQKVRSSRTTRSGRKRGARR